MRTGLAQAPRLHDLAIDEELDIADPLPVAGTVEADLEALRRRANEVERPVERLARADDAGNECTDAGRHDLRKANRHRALLVVAHEMQRHGGRHGCGDALDAAHDLPVVHAHRARRKSGEFSLRLAPVGGQHPQHVEFRIRGQDLQKGIAGRLVDGATGLGLCLVEHARPPHGRRGIYENQVGAGVGRRDDARRYLDERAGKCKREQQEERDTCREQEQVLERLPDVDALLGGLEQHRRAERPALRTLGLQAMQPQRQRDEPDRDQEQRRDETHHCRLCRNRR